MNRVILAGAALLLASTAHAQQAAPMASPMEQALSSKLQSEINENITLRMAIVQQKAKLEELQKQADAAKSDKPAVKE